MPDLNRLRIDVDMGFETPLETKVKLHGRMLAHFQRRKLDKDASGYTAWSWEFESWDKGFNIIWTKPLILKRTKYSFDKSRLMGRVVLRFSRSEVEKGGAHLISGDWEAVEEELICRSRVA